MTLDEGLFKEEETTSNLLEEGLLKILEEGTSEAEIKKWIDNFMSNADLSSHISHEGKKVYRTYGTRAYYYLMCDKLGLTPRKETAYHAEAENDDFELDYTEGDIDLIFKNDKYFKEKLEESRLNESSYVIDSFEISDDEILELRWEKGDYYTVGKHFRPSKESDLWKTEFERKYWNEKDARRSFERYKKIEKAKQEETPLDESKLVEGMKTFLNDLGKEDIQYFKLANKFNYDIKQLRVDNKNKTYEVGQFKIIKRPYMTNNGAEFKRLIAELSARGYTEVGNKLTEDLLLEPTAEDKELVKELLDKYKGTKYEKVLNDLKAKYNFENTAKEYKTEKKKSKFKEDLEYMEKSKFQEDLEEPNFKENLSGNMTVEEIANKHKVPVEEIEKQVEIGIKVEKEHTDNEEEAKRIALDHLFEIADYYDRLTKMEDEAKKELKEDAEETITEVKPVEPLNKELIQKLEDKMVEFRNRYLFDEEDIKIKVDEENPRKIWFLGELTYNKQSELADELDKIVKEYDEDAYFDAEDSGRWFAIIRTEEEKENNKEELKKTYQEIINKLSPLTDEQKETLKRDIEKDGLFVKELDDGKLLVVKEIEESVEGDKIAQDYIDSKNANYEADKQNARDVKLELAKQGITEELSEFEKKAKDTADKLGIEIKLRGNDRFDLETLDRNTLDKFYKELLGVELGDVKGLKEDVAGTKETIVVEDVDTQVDIEHEADTLKDLPTEKEQSIGLSTMINNLITSEYEAIDGYNSAIVTFEIENRPEFTDVFRDILEEERTHIGQLEQILNTLDPTTLKHIDAGQKEAEGQIEENEEQLAEQESPLDESLKK